MRTDELVALLANGTDAVEPYPVGRRYAVAMGWGALGAALLMALTLGVRPDIAAAAQLPMFWVKLAFPAALALGAMVAVARVARPGARLGRVPWALALPVVAMGLLAAITLSATTPPASMELLFGDTWRSCPFSIALLSIPVLGALLWAMTGLAPTRLALAGGCAGLLAGSIGALIYALHCTEMAAPFLATWYVAGMLLPAAAGALLGPRLLRW